MAPKVTAEALLAKRKFELVRHMRVNVRLDGTLGLDDIDGFWGLPKDKQDLLSEKLR